MRNIFIIFGAVMLMAGCITAILGVLGINHLNATVERTSAEYQRQQQVSLDHHRDQMAKIKEDSEKWQQNFAEVSRLEREEIELRSKRRSFEVHSPEYRETTNRLAAIQDKKAALNAARAALDRQSSGAATEVTEMEFMNRSLEALHNASSDQWRAVKASKRLIPICATVAIAGGGMAIAGVVLLFCAKRQDRPSALPG